MDIIALVAGGLFVIGLSRCRKLNPFRVYSDGLYLPHPGMAGSAGCA